MIRAVRIELRRSNALSTFVMLAVATGLVLASDLSIWRWNQLGLGALHQYALFLVVPLALAAGAALGRREKRTRVDEIMASTGRPVWQRRLPAAGALGIAAGLAYLGMFAAASLMIVAGSGYVGRAGLSALVPGLTIVIGGTWLGLALGRFWPSALLPPLLAAGTLVVQVQLLLFHDGRIASLSLARSDQGAVPWLTLSDNIVLSRLSLGLGMLGAGILLLTGRSWGTRGAAAVVGVLGVAGLMLIADPDEERTLRMSDHAQQLVCSTDGGPEVCVSRMHERLLGDVTVEARRALTAIGRLPDAPVRVEELRFDPTHLSYYVAEHTVKPPAGTIYVVLETDGSGNDPDVAMSVAMGGGTYWNGCGPEEGLVPKAVAGAWLLGIDRPELWSEHTIVDSSTWDMVEEQVADLRKLPEDEQLSRVTELRDAARRCESEDRLEAILAGEPS